MASSGPRYPGTTASEIGPSGDNNWISTSPITADDDSEAQITAATYDAGDHSYRLKATNFGFDADVPAGSTIDGITVEIDRRCFAGAAQDQEVRLYDSTSTLVGTDKQTATAWPATLGIATYGGAADTWAAGLDSTDIRSANFGVSLIVLADGANTDIGVDFIRVTVTYTAPADTALAGSSAAVSVASSSITTQIALAGNVPAASSDSGNLTTGIKLAGVADALSTSAGVLTNDTALQGSCAASSTIESVLSTAIALTGASPAVSTSGSVLTTAIALAGDSLAAASVSSILSTGIPLAGLASSVALVSGVLEETVLADTSLAGSCHAQSDTERSRLRGQVGSVRNILFGGPYETVFGHTPRVSYKQNDKLGRIPY